jgi:hypothetical protein
MSCKILPLLSNIDDSQHGGVLKLQRYLTEREWKEFSEGKWRVRFIKSVNLLKLHIVILVN